MGIFNADAPQPKPIVVEDIVNQIKRMNKSLYSGITTQHEAIFNKVWKNPMFTPKQIVDAFGTDAVALFMLSAGLQQMLKQADPSYVVLEAPYNCTPNQDGTVTVGDKKP